MVLLTLSVRIHEVVLFSFALSLCRGNECIGSPSLLDHIICPYPVAARNDQLANKMFYCLFSNYVIVVKKI